jgi:hypothetical protein
MADALDPKLVDKRTAERYLREGILDAKAYERLLKSLPDLAERPRRCRRAWRTRTKSKIPRKRPPSE